jgi:haloalkane dehalogenase
MERIDVLDSFMAYREDGKGKRGPVTVLLHGNPTSSYVWRNVMPALAQRGRCLAPDLIGMGESGKPNCDYRYRDHVRYLDAWFAALDLRDVTLVGYDWGAVFALDWARRNPERVRGVAVFETFSASFTLRSFQRKVRSSSARFGRRAWVRAWSSKRTNSSALRSLMA